MSKVAIQGNASGTGTFTIAAPNSNTDRTLTLPDEAGTVLTSGTPASSIPGYGNIKVAQQWVLPADISSDGIITTFQTVGFTGSIGTTMGYSSGIFTFPETGIYQVLGMFRLANDVNDFMSADLYVSSDNFSSSTRRTNTGRLNRGNALDETESSFSIILDIQDTANDKVAVYANSVGGSSVIVGNSTVITSSVTFIKLGDT